MSSVQCDTNVLVVDDCRSYREAIVSYLSRQPGFGLVRDADSLMLSRFVASDSVLTSSARTVVLTELILGEHDTDGLFERITGMLPLATVVALTDDQDPVSLGRALEAGATAILSKRVGLTEIVQACLCAADGALHTDPAVAMSYLRAASRARQDSERRDRLFRSLSARERQVLLLLAEGHSDREIATTLHISYETVRTHVANILRKLHVSTRTTAVVYAVRNSLIAV